MQPIMQPASQPAMQVLSRRSGRLCAPPLHLPHHRHAARSRQRRRRQLALPLQPHRWAGAARNVLLGGGGCV